MAGPDFRAANVVTGRSCVWRSRCGFTTVELIVVIILVGILGAIAAPRFFNSSEFDSTKFADQAGAIIRFAQKEAIAQNRAVNVRFDGESISLCFTANSPCIPADQVRAPYAVSTDSTYCTSAAWYCVRRPRNVNYTISLGAVSPGASRLISFDALGRPFSDAGLPLSAAMTFAVSNGSGAPSKITIEPETGYVH